MMELFFEIRRVSTYSGVEGYIIAVHGRDVRPRNFQIFPTMSLLAHCLHIAGIVAKEDAEVCAKMTRDGIFK